MCAKTQTRTTGFYFSGLTNRRITEFKGRAVPVHDTVREGKSSLNITPKQAQ